MGDVVHLFPLIYAKIISSKDLLFVFISVFCIIVQAVRLVIHLLSTQASVNCLYMYIACVY